MKIAFCHHYSLSHGGGGERFIIELAEHLNSIGHEVSIYAFPFRKGAANICLPNGVAYKERFIHSFEADVAYFVYVPLLHHLFRTHARKIAGMHSAISVSEHNSLIDYMGQGVLVALEFIALRFLGAIDIRSFDAIHKLLNVGKTFKKKTYVIPNWTKFQRIEKKSGKEREKFSVLYVGKRSLAKGYDLFVDVSNSMRATEIHFASTVETQRSVTDKEGNIEHLGYVDHDRIREILSEASVLLHPTKHESFGITILESLMCGTPVLTTPIQEHLALRLPLIYGSSKEEFIEKLSDLYKIWNETRDEYNQHSQRGIEAVSKFEFSALMPKYEEMFSEMQKLK